MGGDAVRWGEGKKRKDQREKKGQRGCQSTSGVDTTTAKPEQNESKKAAAVQSAALLCSVRVQFRRAMAPDVLNPVNHSLISSSLEWSISVSSCVALFGATLTIERLVCVCASCGLSD